MGETLRGPQVGMSVGKNVPSQTLTPRSAPHLTVFTEPDTGVSPPPPDPAVVHYGDVGACSPLIGIDRSDCRSNKSRLLSESHHTPKHCVPTPASVHSSSGTSTRHPHQL
ncbi:unnamed protein product [Pleuronectes platessa]|uniref:Uncharacterized protein n=1 Tax=Pleuronectes platessa TaxID=8262 RepID=A0A9N7YP43_PLEPL|nr:unnamed protein product [Pleuronectes platessa]